MGIVKCKDCIYGDCCGGKNRSCLQFPDIGKIYTVTDDFFCFTKGKSKEEYKKEMEAKNMMYRCESCGNLFEEGEQAVWHENYGAEIGGEIFDGCPICLGEYEEVYQCKDCGDWHTEDELYDGWCESCLRNTINYDTFFEYCEANKNEQYLDIFVLSELLGGMDCPKNVSYEFHELMVDTYKDRVEQIKRDKNMFGYTYAEIIDACISFIMDDDGECGRENYADWINNRKVVK